MFKTKTFNLVHDDENKKFEKLYDPKRCRWMRYIVIPALIGFALLLVLINVDFSGDTNPTIEESSTTSTLSSSYFPSIEFEGTDVTTGTTHFIEETIKNYGHVEPSSQYLQQMVPRSSDCRPAIGTDLCNIDCFGGWLSQLSKELVDLQNKCGTGGYLKILVRSYAIAGFILKAQDLSGNYRAEYLKFDSVTGNVIHHIEAGAFDIDSMASLKTLILENVNASLLNEETFQGLSLEDFNMTNQAKYFIGSGFLQPFAKSLKQLILQQTDTKTIFDPTNWLQGAHFPLLWKLDLSSNNFGNTLRRETFEMMDAIREIYLMKCQISSIAKGTFDAVAKTLKILDLSNNQLTTLDANFLININGTIKLELQVNYWNCTCENDQLINALKNPNVIYANEPLCKTPELFKNQPIIYPDLNCAVSTTEITTTDKTSSESDGTTLTTTSLKLPTPRPPTSTTTTSSPSTSTSSTLPNIPTNPTNPTGTTPNSDQHLSLYCSSNSLHSSEVDNSIIVRDYDAYFRVTAQTQLSVTFAIRSDMNDLHLIYFLPRDSAYINVTNDIQISPIASRATEINVIGLVFQQLYVFCLIPKDDRKISPFNCLSLYLQSAHAPKSVWLSKTDIGWAITVFIIGLIITLCCGLIAVYFLLRCRPTWLCGSKRIIRKGSKSHEVYLIPKKRDEKEYAEAGKLDIKSYDYMQYYKDLQDSKQNRTIHVNAQMSPYEPAPKLPSKGKNFTSTLPTTMEDTIENIDDDGNDYQSINYYEPMT